MGRLNVGTADRISYEGHALSRLIGSRGTLLTRPKYALSQPGDEAAHRANHKREKEQPENPTQHGRYR